MSYEKIVTLFDTAQHAEAAKSNLAKAGFSTNDISVVSAAELPKSGTALREPGLWHRLFGSDIEQHEAEVYGKAVETGGVVLTLRTADPEVPKAMGILNQHNVVDVQDRAVKTGLLSKAEALPVAAAVAAAVPAKPLTSDVSKDQVLRLAEEQLEVGKKAGGAGHNAHSPLCNREAGGSESDLARGACSGRPSRDFGSVLRAGYRLV
jgi:hypothetical protein